MRKVILWVVVLALAACRAAAPPGTGPAPARGTAVGAADPVAAVEAFIAAARTEDLQAMSVVWGDRRGPVRDQIPRDELERRQIIIIRCLRHDSYRVLSNEVRPDQRRAIGVEFTAGALTRSHSFDAVQGPARRWYVESFDLDLASELCRSR